VHASRSHSTVWLGVGVAAAAHARQIKRVGILEGVDEDGLEAALSRCEHLAWVATRPVTLRWSVREQLRLLARNATTRRREPAGHWRGESFLSVQLVEAGGIEPPSRSISAEASTCIVHHLFFLDPQVSGGQDSFWTRAQPTLSSLPRQATEVKTSLLLSPVPVPQAEPDERRGQLSRERVVRVGTCSVFARCFTRPPDNLGTPLPPQSARSNPIAPGISRV
jgi:hypothetical protein